MNAFGERRNPDHDVVVLCQYGRQEVVYPEIVPFPFLLFLFRRRPQKLAWSEFAIPLLEIGFCNELKTGTRTPLCPWAGFSCGLLDTPNHSRELLQ